MAWRDGHGLPCRTRSHRSTSDAGMPGTGFREPTRLGSGRGELGGEAAYTGRQVHLRLDRHVAPVWRGADITCVLMIWYTIVRSCMLDHMVPEWLTFVPERYLAVVAVAVFGAVQSFNHIRWIGQTHGQGALDSVLLPLSIDGLILAMTLVLLHEASENHNGPLLAWGLLWLGIGATIAANVIFGQRFGRVGIGASVWPAIAFVGAVQRRMTKGWSRSESVLGRGPGVSGGASSADAAEPDPEEAARYSPPPRVGRCGGNPLSQLQLRAVRDLPAAGEGPRYRIGHRGGHHERRPGRGIFPPPCPGRFQRKPPGCVTGGGRGDGTGGSCAAWSTSTATGRTRPAVTRCTSGRPGPWLRGMTHDDRAARPRRRAAGR